MPYQTRYIAKRLYCSTSPPVHHRHHEIGGDTDKNDNRNLQTFWRSVRPDEQDSISTVRPEKMACNWFRGVLVRTFGRGWLQFPIAIRQFSIASDDSGSDFTSL